MARVMVIGALLAMSAQPARAQQSCEQYRVTGYSVNDYPGWTADGTTTTRGAMARGEPIVAASYNVPLGSYISVAGLGVFRVADRGHLGPRHIDVLVSSRSEAFALTGYRQVCVLS